MYLSRRAICAFSLSCFAVAVSLPAASQGAPWPSRPITVVVPFPAGGGTDLVVRAIQSALQKELGQPLVIDNRGGAGGTIGAGYVARAAPDGYTLVVATTSTHALSASMYKALPFRPTEDFAYAGFIGTSPYVLVTHPSVQAADVKSFATLLKQRPSQYSFASVGPGTVSHLIAEVFTKQVGVSIVHVPYKGAAPAYTDLIGGQVQFLFDNPVGLAPYIRAGKVRAIATTAPNALLVGVPTFAQQGISGMDQSLWYGMAFPRNTPPAIVDRFNAALNKVLADRGVAADLAAKGVNVQPGAPQQLRAAVVRDVQAWGKIVKAVGATLD